MASTRLQRQSCSDSKTVKVNLRCTMSDSGDQSKIDKKREYNRNAQRIFRQRRKEHLKNLEASERDRSTAQTEELRRLRREIDELRQENDSLQRLCSSQSTSPCPPSSVSIGPVVNNNSNSNDQFPTPDLSINMNSPESSLPPFPSPPPSATPSLCILVAHSMPQARTYLHSLFRPILESPPQIQQQQHLSLLAALSPSLPSQLRPTDLQLQTPHHIYIDLIPSPSLRNSLITAGPSTANIFLQQICTFASDSLEDQGQLVIWGEDILNEFAWEFSADILEQWGGWLLPAEWGERANFWRVQRGAPTLPAWA